MKMGDFRELFMSSPSPMVLSILEDGRVVEVNRSFTELTGFTREELVGKTSVELGLVTLEDRERFQEALQEQGRFRSMEVTVGTKSGPRFALVSGEVVELDSGPHFLLVGAAIDRQKAFEERFRALQAAQSVAQEVESKFRVIFDQSVELMGVLTLDGILQDVNRAALEMIGAQRDEVVGQPFWETPWWNHSETLQDQLKGWIEQAARGEVVVLEADHPAPEGGLRTVEALLAPIRDASGSPNFLIAVGHDITDRVQAEKELRESQERYRALSEASFEGLTFISEGRFLAVNETLARMLGYEVDELIGRSPLDFVAPESMDLVRNKIESGSEEPYEHLALRKDGTSVPVEVREKATSFQGRSARVTSIRDISWRHETEIALLESEERYESLVANIPDVTWITSRDGHTSFISPNVETVLGYTPQELCDPEGSLWFEGLHPADRDGVTEAFESLFAHGTEFGREYRFRKKDGEWVWLRDRAVQTFEEDGREHAYGVFSDITEQRSLRAQLQQAQKLDTLGTLASGIAHDFNNLLVPILGYADLLREGVAADNPFRTELEGHLFDAAERARELVQQILTFSRSHEPEKALIHPEGPVMNALRLVGATIPSSIRLRRRFGGEFGRFLGDSAQIQQVVVNFCTNAIHAMRRSGGVLSVTLDSLEVSEAFKARNPEFPSGRAVSLEFSDTGEGMDSAVLDRIFDPFFTTKRVGEGTGLGLSIVYGIIKGHDGVVEVESQLGEGTIFKVFLPEVEDAGAAEEAEGSKDVGGAESVLFVDDQAAIRDTAKRLLKHLGYGVTLATGASDALELFKKDPHAFQVVVTDYDMPGMTGVHLALELFEVRPDIPVVLITGSHPLQAKEGEALGIRRHLIKPFTASDLGRVIREALEMES
jgi:PAS domain S-box-containing protein